MYNSSLRIGSLPCVPARNLLRSRGAATARADKNKNTGTQFLSVENMGRVLSFLEALIGEVGVVTSVFQNVCKSLQKLNKPLVSLHPRRLSAPRVSSYVCGRVAA